MFCQTTKKWKLKLKKSNRIFVVYGHNEEMKECCLNSKSWTSKRVFLHEQPKGGKTITKEVVEYLDVCFSVLFSRDDLDYQKDRLF